MRIDCPHCGRKGRLPDGSKLPSVVRCPGCGGQFEPHPILDAADYAAPAEEPPSRQRRCDFCDEPIAAGAKKCKHCGEILDPVLRAAQSRSHAPVSAAASASTTVIVKPNEGCFSGCLKWVIVTIFAFIVICIIAASMR